MGLEGGGRGRGKVKGRGGMLGFRATLSTSVRIGAFSSQLVFRDLEKVLERKFPLGEEVAGQGWGGEGAFNGYARSRCHLAALVRSHTIG